MTHFIIDSKDLKSFLSSISLDGLVVDCLIKVEQKKLTCLGLDTAKSIYYSLSCKAEVKKLGKLAIGDIKTFGKILDRFEGEIEVIVDKKGIKVKQKRKNAKLESTKEKVIDSIVRADEIKVDGQKVKTPQDKTAFKYNYIIVSANSLKEVVKDADTLEENIYAFDLRKDSIVVKVEKDSRSFSTKIKPSESLIKKPMTIDLGYGTKEIFSTLSGDVKIFFDPKFKGILVRHGKKFRNIHIITMRG